MRVVHLGKDFDDYLKGEDNYLEMQLAAIKRVIAYKINQRMHEQGLSKSAMARQLGVGRSTFEILIDPTNVSITLPTLYRAARALGLSIQINLV